MYNHTAVAKAFATAACTLVIALLTIGMGVNSTWAGSDPPIVQNFTPLSPALHINLATANHMTTSRSFPAFHDRLAFTTRAGCERQCKFLAAVASCAYFGFQLCTGAEFACFNPALKTCVNTGFSLGASKSFTVCMASCKKLPS